MSAVRRGVYLSELEAATLAEIERRSGFTPSSILRVGLRALVGMPLGVDGRELVAELERERCTSPAETTAVRV